MLKTKQVLLIFSLSYMHFVACNDQDVKIQEWLSYLPTKLDSCSKYFQYQRIDDFINGRLQLFNVKINDTVKMTFYRSDFIAQPRFNGILLPDESAQTIINKIQNGQVITYRVDFPITRSVPKLINIFLNGNELCATKFYASEEILELQHTLEMTNGSLPVFTYNINIPNFVETTIRELTPLIYGGTKVSRGEHPWLTAIYKKRRTAQSFICGGSLVTSSIILTAAHCFEGLRLNETEIVVMLGRHDLSNLKEESFVIRQIETLILHPEYKFGLGFSDADLALLEMKNNVSFTPFIKPICLWSEPVNESNIVNHSGIVAGWGDNDEGMTISNVPKKVKLNIVPEAVCLRSSVAFNAITSARTFCAGNRDGSGPCEGDSGGGLMINQNGLWMLRGVVSAGLKNESRCNLLQFTVYCDIAKHISWLKSYIDQNEPPITDSSSTKCGIADIELQKQPTTEDICGISDMNARNEHPWLGAIYRKTLTGLIFVYTGVLISSRFVLAPSYWFLLNDSTKYPPGFFRIFLGRYDLKDIHENEVLTRDVAALIFHPDFKLLESPLLEDNIVLIQMKSPITFTEFVKPICLWGEFNDGLSQIVAQSATVSSWDVFGLFDESFTTPITINLNITSIKRCESWRYNETISSRHLCVPRFENRFGAILMLKRNERWFLRGIDSLRHDYYEYTSKQYFVYSDIAKFLSWIRNNMKT